VRVRACVRVRTNMPINKNHVRLGCAPELLFLLVVNILK